jgi:hypothetical protein
LGVRMWRRRGIRRMAEVVRMAVVLEMSTMLPCS